MTLGHNSQQLLRDFVARIERMGEEIEALQSDRKEIYAEAKGVGFDAPTIRRQIRRRKKDRVKQQEEDALDDTYAHALGDQAEPPLAVIVGKLVNDATGSDQVIEALKAITPRDGEIKLRLDGQALRIFRDGNGAAQVEVVDE